MNYLTYTSVQICTYSHAL